MVLLERIFKMDEVSLQQIFNRIPLLKYWYFKSCPSDYVLFRDLETFANYENVTQHYADGALNKECKLSSQIVFCRPSRSISFLQEAVQADDARAITIPSQPLPFLHDICSFCLFKFREKENTGVLDVFVLSLIRNYM